MDGPGGENYFLSKRHTRASLIGRIHGAIVAATVAAIVAAIVAATIATTVAPCINYMRSSRRRTPV